MSSETNMTDSEVTQKPPTHKAFKVAAVSANQNAFGLYLFTFVAADGTAWHACGNDLRRQAMPRGHKVDVPLYLGEPDFTSLQFEIPKPVPFTGIAEAGRAPDAIVKQVWADNFPQGDLI